MAILPGLNHLAIVNLSWKRPWLHRVLIMLSFLGVSTLAPAHDTACTNMAKATPEVLVFNVDGRHRECLVDAPRNLRTHPGLVFVWHGFGGNARSMREESGFVNVMEKHNFVFVYPEGVKDKDGRANFQVGYIFQNKHIDDVKFAKAILARVDSMYKIDHTAVFATGMSNGADMCYFLARQANPIVQAIAPVAGCMMTDWATYPCPNPNMAVMEVHGTNDSVTHWAGDVENHEGWGGYLGTEAVMDYWVQALKLDQEERKFLQPASPAKDDAIELRRWWNKKTKGEVLLYVMHGGDHLFPKYITKPEVPISEDILQFFELPRLLPTGLRR